MQKSITSYYVTAYFWTYAGSCMVWLSQNSLNTINSKQLVVNFEFERIVKNVPYKEIVLFNFFARRFSAIWLMLSDLEIIIIREFISICVFMPLTKGVKLYQSILLSYLTLIQGEMLPVVTMNSCKTFALELM